MGSCMGGLLRGHAARRAAARLGLPARDRYPLGTPLETRLSGWRRTAMEPGAGIWVQARPHMVECGTGFGWSTRLGRRLRHRRVTGSEGRRKTSGCKKTTVSTATVIEIVSSRRRVRRRLVLAPHAPIPSECGADTACRRRLKIDRARRENRWCHIPPFCRASLVTLLRPQVSVPNPASVTSLRRTFIWRGIGERRARFSARARATCKGNSRHGTLLVLSSW